MLISFEDRIAADMAVGLAITSEGGQYYNGKVTPFVVLSCIVAATGGLIFGYDIGISGFFPAHISFRYNSSGHGLSLIFCVLSSRSETLD